MATQHPYDSTALTTILDQGFSQRQVDIIRTQIAPDATDDQLALFLEVCRGTGLNPFMRQIYAVFRNAKEADGEGKWRTVKRMTIQTGIDGYRLIAARTGLLAGIDDAVFDSEDAEHPGKASVTVYRYVRTHNVHDRVAFTASARWREYVQEKDEYRDNKKTGRRVPTEMWAKMPYLMLAKCAEALALRKAFPAELSGIYTGDEMAQADNNLPTPPTTPPPATRPALRPVEPEPADNDTHAGDEDGDETITYTVDDEPEPTPPAAATAAPTVEPMTTAQRGEMENLCQWLGKTFDASKIEDTHHAAKVLIALRKQWAEKIAAAKKADQAAQATKARATRTRNAVSAMAATMPAGETADLRELGGTGTEGRH